MPWFGTTIASGSVLTELIVGRSISECFKLMAEDLIDVERRPAHNRHAPHLAITALTNALAQHLLG